MISILMLMAKLSYSENSASLQALTYRVSVLGMPAGLGTSPRCRLEPGRGFTMGLEPFEPKLELYIHSYLHENMISKIQHVMLFETTACRA